MLFASNPSNHLCSLIRANVVYWSKSSSDISPFKGDNFSNLCNVVISSASKVRNSAVMFSGAIIFKVVLVVSFQREFACLFLVRLLCSSSAPTTSFFRPVPCDRGAPFFPLLPHFTTPTQQQKRFAPLLPSTLTQWVLTWTNSSTHLCQPVDNQAFASTRQVDDQFVAWFLAQVCSVHS